MRTREMMMRGRRWRRLAEKWEDKEEILQDADEDGEQDREARRLR